MAFWFLAKITTTMKEIEHFFDMEIVGMRLLLELKSVNQSVVSNGRTQVRLKGVDKNGRPSNALAYGFTAENILKSLYKIVDPTTDLSERSVTIDLHGDWKNGKEYEKEGQKFTYRYFEIDQFQFLLGPALELQKIRQDSLAAFHRAEAFRAEGDFRSAYRELLAQAGRTCNMIDEVSEIVESLNRYDELPDDFDVPATEEPPATPEATALKKFSSMNRVEDAMQFAGDAPKEEASHEEAAEVSGVGEEASADDDDYVFGEAVDDEPLAEDAPADEAEEGLDEGQTDVLDDEPEAPAEEEAPEASDKPAPAPAPTPKPASGFGRPAGGFGRPMGGGFGRPG